MTALTGIRPAVAKNETTITISGQNLGSSQGSSKLFLESQNLQKASKWNPSEIQIAIPGDAETGKIHAGSFNFSTSFSFYFCDALARNVRLGNSDFETVLLFLTTPPHSAGTVTVQDSDGRPGALYRYDP